MVGMLKLGMLKLGMLIGGNVGIVTDVHAVATSNVAIPAITRRLIETMFPPLVARCLGTHALPSTT
jgi:hypothetical protein